MENTWWFSSKLSVNIMIIEIIWWKPSTWWLYSILWTKLLLHSLIHFLILLTSSIIIKCVHFPSSNLNLCFVFFSLDQVSDGMTDAEVLVNFLVQLSDTNTMKTIVAQSLMKRIVDIDTISSDRKPLSSSSVSSFSTPVLSPFERRGDTSFFSCGMSSDSFDDIVNFTFLDFLMDFVAQFEFPQKIVTFLLHLLPNADYKVGKKLKLKLGIRYLSCRDLW